jgi:SAM-dependent methyltransferase
VFYGPDLSYVHDAGFGFLARAAAPALAAMLRRAGFDRGLVVDLACGTGIGAEILAGEGFDVLGVDLSANQLAIARERVPQARFEQGSLFDFEPPRCAAISCIGEGLCYTADERAGRAAARRVFEHAHTALEPGGILLFDVVTPGRERPEPRRAWYEGDGWVICIEVWEEPDARLLRRRNVTFLPDGDRWRRHEELHTQLEFPPDDVLADLADAGFEASRLSSYGDFGFKRGHAGFAAIKPR